MVQNWLTGIENKTRRLIYVGVAALMWAIWCTRNDAVFDKKRKSISFMQVVFRGAY
jgi:hypothetical protein